MQCHLCGSHHLSPLTRQRGTRGKEHPEQAGECVTVLRVPERGGPGGGRGLGRAAGCPLMKTGHTEGGQTDRPPHHSPVRWTPAVAQSNACSWVALGWQWGTSPHHLGGPGKPPLPQSPEHQHAAPENPTYTCPEATTDLPQGLCLETQHSRVGDSLAPNSHPGSPSTLRPESFQGAGKEAFSIALSQKTREGGAAGWGTGLGHHRGDSAQCTLAND